MHAYNVHKQYAQQTMELNAQYSRESNILRQMVLAEANLGKQHSGAALPSRHLLHSRRNCLKSAHKDGFVGLQGVGQALHGEQVQLKSLVGDDAMQ